MAETPIAGAHETVLHWALTRAGPRSRCDSLLIHRFCSRVSRVTKAQFSDFAPERPWDGLRVACQRFSFARVRLSRMVRALEHS